MTDQKPTILDAVKILGDNGIELHGIKSDFGTASDIPRLEMEFRPDLRLGLFKGRKLLLELQSAWFAK